MNEHPDITNQDEEEEEVELEQEIEKPEDINRKDIEAKFKNGVLTLKIPKQTISSTEKHVIEIK